MRGYYDQTLAGDRLLKVYELASPRIRQYLDREAEFVVEHIKPGDVVLDLGCGFGRIIPRLARKASLVIGIDTSLVSLRLGHVFLSRVTGCRLLAMDAAHLGFRQGLFDAVVCVQNGVSAFRVDPRRLFEESLRVAKPGGLCLFSTYSEKFWKHRLAWFERQARAGLLGEIDYDRTGQGVIVCRDGFQASTVTGDQFQYFADGLDARVDIVEVDSSSLFCRARKSPTASVGRG